MTEGEHQQSTQQSEGNAAGITSTLIFNPAEQAFLRKHMHLNTPLDQLLVAIQEDTSIRPGVKDLLGAMQSQIGVDTNASQEIIIRRYNRYLESFLYRRGIPIDDRPAIIQDVFVAWIETENRGETIENLGGYFYVVATNLMKMYWRNRFSRVMLSLDELMERNSSLLHTARPVGGIEENTVVDPEEVALGNIAADDILTLLERLTPEQRAVVQLHMEGYQSPQIAQMLGIQAGTVRARLMRALDSFKRFQKEEEDL